jgi:hypothetical protein
MTSIIRLFRPVSLALIFVVTTTSFSNAAATDTPIDSATLQQKLVARGIGKGVKVSEVDGTVVKGILVSIDADSFQITPKGAAQPTRVSNTQVHKFSNDGLSTAGKIGVGVAIGFGILLVLGIIASRTV